VFAIPKSMRAVVYRGVNDLRLETVPVPRIGADELLVKVAVCGVCPTDIKKIQHGTVPPPRIFGHETAGTIVKIGGGGGVRASGLKAGDRVALHHHVPCLRCHFCRHGAYAQCETYKRTGITAGFEPAGGGYAEYVRVMPFVLPGVVKIPAKNSFEEGAMLEPVNTVLKAVKRLNLLAGDNVLVAGQGPIGLMFTKILQLRGMNVLATDLLESRLKLAKKFGAKWALNAARPPHEPGNIRYRTANEGRRSQQDCPNPPHRPSLGSYGPTGPNPLPGEREPASDGRRAAKGGALDAAVIAVPSDAAVHQALQLVRGAGQVLLFAHTKRAAAGKPKADAHPLDFSSICLDEKDLIGSYSADFTLQQEVARLVFSRRFDVRPLITHNFPLDETANAIALASHPTEASLKLVVHVEVGE
jgi:L-iditol 2-dehydrogenase